MHGHKGDQQQHAKAVQAAQFLVIAADPVGEVQHKEEGPEKGLMAAFSVHAKACKHDDEHEDHAHGHSGLGKGVVPDIGAWFLVQKKVPADVVPQFVPPGFAPDRQDDHIKKM